MIRPTTTLARHILAAAAFFSLISLGETIRAEPLAELQCKALKEEYDKLLYAGVKSDVERGAEWGKANLPRVRLELIQRLITVEEQLSFRCGELVTARPTLLNKAETTAPPTSYAKGNAAAKPPATPPKKKKRAKKTSDAFSPPASAAPGAPADATSITPPQPPGKVGVGD